MQGNAISAPLLLSAVVGVVTEREVQPLFATRCANVEKYAPFNEGHIYFRHFGLGHFAASINIVDKKG
ncbi:hypothetical protein IQ229_19810 [Nostoc cf. edaphicum LEGE 07299]|uniref:Uncharacterized protein n=1 Tax=Nostoc cf. edaphicum LEGE 07299 TaxID=2777974 RepID=A0ABR9U5G4_9NOSO|nr:hypothetical protein [Nostoc edaphicum]MBE9107085.1 hypothetical protein [Nostoc cf. edaphicum LEGE 07299]